MNKQLQQTETVRGIKSALAEPAEPGSVVPLILAVVAVSLLAIAGLLFFTFTSLDQQVGENIRERVQIALDLEIDRQEDLLQEVTYWDEAHLKLVVEKDPVWVDYNLGPYLFEAYGTNVAIAARADMTVLASHLDGEPLRVEAGELQELSLDELVEQAKGVGEIPYIVSAYRRFRGGNYRFSVGLLLDEVEEAPKGDGSFILIGRRLDDGYFRELGERYRLPGLRVGPPRAEPDLRQLVLRGGDGDALASLAWDNAKQARDHLARVLPGVAFIFALMAILSWRLLAREHRNRQRYAERLREMANKDFLTGVCTRREFYGLANRELIRSQREQRPISLLMLDIDHFKQVNDTWGHEAGDRVLAEFTRVVEQNLRECDVLGRLGGEEFAALLVSTDLQHAQVIAERICRVIDHHRFDASTEAPVTCSVSIGLAVWQENESLDKLLSRVDKALYAAKHGGRNQVVLARST